MVLGKRTREHSSDSNSGCCFTDKPISSPPLRIIHEHDDDDVVSGMEAMLRRRKQPKTTPLSSSSNNKMTWTKDDELIILGSIVDYEKETKLSHRSDWDAFYGYVKDFIEADFSRKQLTDKIRNLNKRFLGNKASCNDEEGPSFTSTQDDEVYKLSMIIWDTTECASDENVDQAKDHVPCVEHERVDENVDQAKVDAPSVEHEPVNENTDQAKDVLSYVEHERVDENIEQAKDALSVEHGRVDVDENMELAKRVLELNKDAPCVEHERVNEDTDQEVDVPCMEHEGVNENMNQEEAIPCTVDEPLSNASIETDKGEKEKSEEEFCALKDALTDKENNEEDGVDELCPLKKALTDKEEKEKSEDEYCALKDAFEATTFFQTIGKYQQNLLLENLKNLRGPRRKELADECKELIDEEMKLCAKKLSFSTKLASAWEEESC